MLVDDAKMACDTFKIMLSALFKMQNSAVRLMFAETRQPKTRGRFSIQLKFFSSIEGRFFLFKFYCSLDNFHYAQVSK